MELSQSRLEEMVVGKPQTPTAQFFEKAMLDVEASKREGRRIYRTEVFILIRQQGVRDAVPYLAQQSDIRAYPEEYEYFLKNRQGGESSPSVEIIPKLPLEHLQELIDTGLTTINALASVERVPPHLEYAHRRAIQLNNLLENQHGEKESPVENRIETQNGSAADRPEHPTDLGQSDVPRSPRDGDREAAERIRQGGQEHRGQGRLTQLDNWSFELTL